MSLLKALMNNDYSKEEALDIINEMRDRVLTEGENPDDVLYIRTWVRTRLYDGPFSLKYERSNS